MMIHCVVSAIVGFSLSGTVVPLHRLTNCVDPHLKSVWDHRSRRHSSW